MNDSAPDKKPKEQTQFSPKKTLVKGNIVLILPIILTLTPIDGSCYRVIDSSLDFFSSVLNFFVML